MNAATPSVLFEPTGFDYPSFFFGCGRDLINSIFECCPLGALVRFAGTSREARESVQKYIRLRICRILQAFIGPENVAAFLNLLAESNSAIVGSVALKVMLNGCGSDWVAQDLNVATSRGGLRMLSNFLRGIRYELSGTGVRLRFMDGAFTHSIYVNPIGNAVTITEALDEDSFFSVVVGSGHTGLMNFISRDHLGCLYPIQTLKRQVVYAYRRTLGRDAHCNLLERGFDVVKFSCEHPRDDPLCCPVTQRQLLGLSGVGLFEWNKPTSPSNLLTRSYTWTLGDDCWKNGCSVKAFERCLKRRKSVSDGCGGN